MNQRDGSQTGPGDSYAEFIRSPEGQGLAQATRLITQITMLRGHMADYAALLRDMKVRHDHEMSEMRSRLAQFRQDAQSEVLSDDEKARFASDIKSLEESLRLIKQTAAQVKLEPDEDLQES